MFKVINGKRYDTSTAQEVASWDNGLGASDFHNYEETLYRKQTGEYFLYGEGGPMSPYRKSTGQNTWSGGAAIKPLSIEEAREWAEKKLSGDEYEEIFGEIEEPEPIEKVTAFSMLMPTAILETLRERKLKTGISVGDQIIRILNEAGYK
ncbi:MAG: hypothetical protein FWH42_01465 [Dehalococcoidia bacterium]|nr:hypothetical protein [Dehalococcoidia bacterium]